METVDKLLREFKDYLIDKNFTKDSIRVYHHGVKIFLQSNPEAKNYNYQDILNFFDPKSYRIWSDNTWKGQLIHIKKYYDFLLETGEREDHPCYSLNLKGTVNKAVIQSDLFSMTELEILMNREEKFAKMIWKNRVIISLLIYQGLMPGEIIRLRTKDIDLDAGIIRVQGGRVLTTRTLELHIKQIRILDRYIHGARANMMIKTKTDRLLINYRGVPDNTEGINYLIYTYKPLFPDKILNSKIIRDSVISYWLNDRKIRLEQVQLMAGHRWISSTERYKYESIDEQKEILRKVHPLG